LNNCLNGIVLQTSILQMRTSPDSPEELGVIRQQAKQAAELIRPLQPGRGDDRQPPPPTDLNLIVRQVVDAQTDGSHRIHMDLAVPLPALGVNRYGLLRLVGWLLHTALLRQPPEAGPVIVRTRSDTARVSLIVEDSGPAPPEPVLAHLFGAEAETGDHVRMLERLAGRFWLRKFNATLEAQTRSEGGLTLTVQWSF
jgi:signal transduction histidine kinase